MADSFNVTAEQILTAGTAGAQIIPLAQWDENDNPPAVPVALLTSDGTNVTWSTIQPVTAKDYPVSGTTLVFTPSSFPSLTTLSGFVAKTGTVTDRLFGQIMVEVFDDGTGVPPAANYIGSSLVNATQTGAATITLVSTSIDAATGEVTLLFSDAVTGFFQGIQAG
jgi:hypothetical protein